MYGICSQCDIPFEAQEDFISHSCVTESKSLSRVERLQRLLKSGGCSQEYYDTQLKELK